MAESSESWEAEPFADDRDVFVPVGDPYSGGMSAYDPQEFRGPGSGETEDGLFEITIRVRGATKVNRLLSWIVRSRAYDDVDGLSVAFEGEESVEQKAG